MTFSNAFTLIKQIAQECFMQPKAAEKLMRKIFNLSMKYQNKLWTKVTLERLVNNNVGTNEVVKFAQNQANKSTKLISTFNKLYIVV